MCNVFLALTAQAIFSSNINLLTIFFRTALWHLTIPFDNRDSPGIAFTFILNCSLNTWNRSLLNSLTLSESIVPGVSKIGFQCLIYASTSSFFLDFTTATALHQLHLVAWSTMCNIRIPFKSAAITSLKSFERENLTNGLNLFFLYFKQTWQFCSTKYRIFNSSRSFISDAFINVFVFSGIASTNWQCNLFATLNFWISLTIH